MTIDQCRTDPPCPVRVERLAPEDLEEPAGVKEKMRLDLGKLQGDVADPSDLPRPPRGEGCRFPLAGSAIPRA